MLKKILFAVLLFASPVFATLGDPIYVSSVVGTDGDGSTWSSGKTSITLALASATVTNTIIYVDSAHSSTTVAAINYNLAGAGLHISIISVDRCGLTGTGNCGWLPGATETEDTNTTPFNIATTAQNQSWFIYGLTVRGDNGNSSANDINIGVVAAASGNRVDIVLSSCTLSNRATSATAEIRIGMDGSSAASGQTRIQCFDCRVNGQDVTSGNIISFGLGVIEFVRLTAGFSGANKPAGLFSFDADAGGAQVSVTDSDLTGYDKSGGAYVVLTELTQDFVIRNCKLHPTPGITSGTSVSDSAALYVINSGTSTLPTYSCYKRLGTLTLNSSIYYSNGTRFNSSPFSWKIVTTGSASEGTPFISPWLMRWSGNTSSMSGSFAVTSDSTTVFNNVNMWGEIEYVSSTTLPLGGYIVQRSSTPFVGTPGASWATDSNVWVGTGSFTNVNNNILTSSFTPGQASLLRGRLNIASPSQTIYLDPQLTLSTEPINPSVAFDEVGAMVIQPGATSSPGAITIYDSTLYDATLH